MTVALFLFVLKFYNSYSTFILSHSNSTFIRRHLPRSSPFSHRRSAQWENPPLGAAPRIELGPALQQADVLPTELCRTLYVLRCIVWSYAAPSTCYAHPLELRRTLYMLRRTS
jgi:hypothetical protein